MNHNHRIYSRHMYWQLVFFCWILKKDIQYVYLFLIFVYEDIFFEVSVTLLLYLRKEEYVIYVTYKILEFKQKTSMW